ncbi:MAG: hypothetical protein ACLFSQ_05135 [Candidatus Zixiibacteriota bacterium]
MCKKLIILFVFVLCSFYAIYGIDSQKIELLGSKYWSYITDFIPISSNDGVAVYKTGIRSVHFNSEKNYQNFHGSFLFGDIISARKDNSNILVLARSGYLYFIEKKRNSIFFPDTIILDNEVFNFDINYDKIAIMSQRCVYFFDKTNIASMDSICFPKPLTSIALSENYCFIANGTDSIYKLNLQNRKGTNIKSIYPAENLYFDDGFLFITTFEKPISVTKCEGDSLIHLGEFGQRDEFYSSLAYQDSVLYASIMDKGFVSWDLAELPKERVLWSYENWSLSQRIVTDYENIFLLNGWQGMDFYQIDENSRIEEKASFRPNISVIDAEAFNERAYIALGKKGIGIFEQEQPEKEKYQIKTNGFCRDIAIAGNNIIVAVEGIGLIAYKQDSIKGLKHLHTIETQRAFSAGGNRYFFAFFDMIDRKINFYYRMGDDFIGAKEKAEYEIPGIAREFAFTGKLAAVSIDMHGVWVFSVDDTVKKIAEIEMDNPRGLVFEGNELLIADGREGLIAYDLSEPSLPEKKWQLQLKGASDIAFTTSHYIAIADDKAAVLISKDKKSSPEIITSYPNSGLGTRIAVMDDNIYSADQYSLYHFRLF